MVEEATVATAEPRRKDFFPCPSKALQVESSLYIKQYPQLYYGHARDGCPVFISQPGVLNIDALECLTNSSNLIDFHWYAMMHEFNQRLKEVRTSSNAKFKRYECVCILDLAHLTPSALGKKTLNIVKVQSAIDSLCFPETLNKLIIVNAPAFFALTWKVIRGWIDPRTASKVDVLGSGKSKLLKKLSTFIDPAKLPSDYGGSGESIAEFLKKDMLQAAQARREVGSILRLVEEDPCLISFKGRTSRSISVEAREIVKLSFLTRILAGSKVTVKDASSGKVLCSVNVVHQGKSDDDTENECPTRYDLDDHGLAALYGPGTFDVEFDSNAGGRSKMNVMMAIKTYVAEGAKAAPKDVVGEREKPQDALVIDTARAATAVSAESICTGVFSPTDGHTHLSVTESPGTERNVSALRSLPKPAAKTVDSNCDYGGIPKIKRVPGGWVVDTTGHAAPTDATVDGLKRQVSQLSQKYSVSDSPQHGTAGTMCGIFSNPCK